MASRIVRWTGWIILVCACGFVAILLTGAIILGKYEEISQDAVSKAVRSTHYIGWIPYKRSILWQPDEWDPAKAQWNIGLTLAFSRPITTNDIVLIKCAERVSIIKFDEVSFDRVAVSRFERSAGEWTEASSNADFISLNANDEIRWSFHSSGSVFLYASPFVPALDDGSSKCGIALARTISEALQLAESSTVRWAFYPWELR